MITEITELSKYKELMYMLVIRNIKIRYKGSVIGFFWTLLNPILMIILYSIFLKILKFYNPADREFLAKLIIGVISWHFVSMTVNDGLHSIIDNATLIKKVPFPKEILPVSIIISNLINFVLSMIIVILFIPFTGTSINIKMIWLIPLAIFLETILVTGVTLLVASLNVFLRDIEHITSVGLTVWFFLSPVVYWYEQIPVKYHKLSILNPLAGIIHLYRCVLPETKFLPAINFVISIILSFSVFFTGYIVFEKLQDKFSEEL